MKRRNASRPKLPSISEQMKAWSAALMGEVGDWPHVTTRAFFGLSALYRKHKIFALLPRTRGLESPTALVFRLEAPAHAIRTRLSKDPRIVSARIKEVRWFSFELSSDTDLRDALAWLSRAYEAAGKPRKSG